LFLGVCSCGVECGKSVARVWQECGKSVARVWKECGKSVETSI